MKDEIDSLLFFLAFIRRKRNELLVFSLSLTSRHSLSNCYKNLPGNTKNDTKWPDAAREVISVMVLMGESDRSGRGCCNLGGFYSLVWAGADHRRTASGTRSAALQKLGPA